jgi:hypothetical protein
MTEREVQLLGFERRDEFSDWDGDWHYYVYEITNGLSFITSATNEVTETGEWFVEIFNTQDPVRFYKFEEVQSLINLLEKHLIKTA